MSAEAPDDPQSTLPGVPWWRPDRHAARRPALLLRNRLRAAIRVHFETEGFTEVETGALQTSPGNEAHLHAFCTESIGADGGRRPLYLHTSPEFACKKLLAAGERRIFDFATVYRNRERGPLHHPEFTLLEWYRAEEPYEALMADAEALLGIAADVSGKTEFSWRGRRMDPLLAPERLSVAEAFERYAGIDILATVSPSGAQDPQGLARAATASGVRVAPDDAWSDIFSKVLVEHVEPRLGVGRATILYGYPASEAALARLSPDEPNTALRFELYACGVELANAFEELTDPLEQRRRLEAEMTEKLRVYGERYPIDEDFLRALAVMPPASGAALGFDRLLLLAAGASSLDDVVWAPPPDGR